MTSKRDVYTWIADYACKYRLTDVIGELFDNLDRDMFSYRDISCINLKNAIVWMTIKNDWQEEYEDAILAVDSLLDKAVASISLELFIRLSLGLRLKDLSHSLSLPVDTFEQKLKRYFPGTKFQLENKYLSKVFSIKELQDFENTVADICKYFRTLVKNESEKMNLLDNYEDSHFGIKLSESLKSLTEEFFDRLSQHQPLNKLEQAVQCGVGSIVKDNTSSPWHAWLADRLFDIHIMNGDVVRHLLKSLQCCEAVGSVNHPNVIQDSGEKEKKRTLESSTSTDVRPSQEVILCYGVEHFSEGLCRIEDKTSLDQNDCVSLVPSSQGEQDVWAHGKLNGYKKSTCCGNYNIPNLQQFLKQDGIRGCVVMLQRIMIILYMYIIHQSSQADISNLHNTWQQLVQASHLYII